MREIYISIFFVQFFEILTFRTVIFSIGKCFKYQFSSALCLELFVARIGISVFIWVFLIGKTLYFELFNSNFRLKSDLKKSFVNQCFINSAEIGESYCLTILVLLQCLTKCTSCKMCQKVREKLFFVHIQKDLSSASFIVRNSTFF